jgi:uncharacterized protein (TIGR03382 family)
MSPGAETADDASVVELREDIRQHRAELAATVDALAVKLDVKAKLRAKALELKPYAVPASAGLAGVVVLAVVVRRRRS